MQRMPTMEQTYEWRAKHPNKVREANKRYWERRVERLAAEQGGSNGKC